jgi:hypothetical protein
LESSVGNGWILGDELIEFCKFLRDFDLMPDRHSFINKSNKQTVTFTFKNLIDNRPANNSSEYKKRNLPARFDKHFGVKCA